MLFNLNDKSNLKLSRPKYRLNDNDYNRYNK